MSDFTLVSGPALDKALGISRSTRHAWVKAGTLPQPLYITDRSRPRWLARDVARLIDQRRGQ